MGPREGLPPEGEEKLDAGRKRLKTCKKGRMFVE